MQQAIEANRYDMAKLMSVIPGMIWVSVVITAAVSVLAGVLVNRQLIKNANDYREKYRESNEWSLQLEEQIEQMQPDQIYTLAQMKLLKQTLMFYEQYEEQNNVQRTCSSPPLERKDDDGK
ncbi:MAG: hypothetical protein DI535_22780 [Citrobacter freundii]|nr:MAG: hypothetical protein DI535_22780 [Citrobacter freundii]